MKQNKRNIKTSQTNFGVVQCFRDKMPLLSLYHNYSNTVFEILVFISSRKMCAVHKECFSENIIFPEHNESLVTFNFIAKIKTFFHFFAIRENEYTPQLINFLKYFFSRKYFSKKRLHKNLQL